MVRGDLDVEFGADGRLAVLSESVPEFVISQQAQHACGEFVPLRRREQQPVLPSSTSSGMPATRLAITAVPSAIASIRTIGRPSMKLGNTRMSEDAISLKRLLLSKAARERDFACNPKQLRP